MQRVQVCDLGVAGRTLSVSPALGKLDMLLSSDHLAELAASRRLQTPVAQLTIGAYALSPPVTLTASTVPPTTTLLVRVFNDAPERVDAARFFAEMLQLTTEKVDVVSTAGRPAARVEIGRLRELTLHRSVMDAHAFACLFSALPSVRTVESLCLEEPNAAHPWELSKLECAWLAYAIFHPRATTSSWKRLEMRNCDPLCIDEVLDLPPDRKVEILSATRLSRLQRNKKRKHVTATRLLVLTKQTWLESCNMQTRQWVCVLVPGFGFGWVWQDAVEETKAWTPGAREDQPASAPSLVPSLTSLKLRGECLSIKQTQSLVRALGSSLESLELKTSRMHSRLLQDIAEACPRLRALLIKTQWFRLKGSALRESFSDAAVARHLRSLTLNWGICNPPVLLGMLSAPARYPVANTLEELHLCYIPAHDYFTRRIEFIDVLHRNLVLERLYLSGGEPFEQLAMDWGFNDKIVAHKKTVRERLAFLSALGAVQRPALSAPPGALMPAAAAPPVRPNAFCNLSVDLIKIVFAFGLTQQVVGSWPPPLPRDT